MSRAAATVGLAGGLAVWLAVATPAPAAGPDPALARLGAEIAAREAALADARAALRRVALERRDAVAALRGGSADAFAALAALDRLGRAPPAAFVAHPQGPLAAARAAMALRAAAPALVGRAQAVRAALEALDAAAADGARAMTAVETALDGMRTTREAAAARLADAARAADPGSADGAADGAAVETLAALVARHGGAAAEAAAGGAPRAAVAPVAGLSAAREGDGLRVTAPAWAVVRAPLAATLRHVGKVRGRGLTALLEPQAGVLIALSGLATVERTPGAVLAAGEPIGWLGGPPPTADEFLIDALAPTGTITPQTLYIEVTRAGAPVDPAEWFPPGAPLATDAGGSLAGGGAVREGTKD